MNEPISSLEKWMITATVMLVAIIEVLDVTIVNVSLNEMMGGFGATSEEITWVITAYLVSSAIFMPLTGVLIRSMGCKRLLIANIIGFLFASMLCGASTTLDEIIFFRILQGIFGASLVPISQFVLRNTFSREEQGKATAIWGMGIMVAPILGPTLGGYITEGLNWRWVFYINVPVCILAFFMALTFIKETPRHAEKMDWLGLILMAVGVGSLQMVLDMGDRRAWFESNLICILTFVCICFLAAFIYRGWRKPDNIVKLRLFSDRHFMASTLILTLFTMAFFGCVVMQPLMLQALFNYTPDIAGASMAPRGLVSALFMFLVIPLNKVLDSRIIIAAGVIIAAAGTFLMTQFSMDASIGTIIIPGLFQGAGLGLVMMPVSAAAFDYLSKTDVAEAAGLFSFGRSMGTSIGVSLLSTVLTRETQINWNQLVQHVGLTQHNYLHWATLQNLSPNSLLTIKLAAQQVQQQSMMLAFLDTYWTSAIMLLLILPLILLLKKAQPKAKP